MNLRIKLERIDHRLFSHKVLFLNLSKKLAAAGYPVRLVESGSRDLPTLKVRLEGHGIDAAEAAPLDATGGLRIFPPSRRHGVNAKIAFRNLSSCLESKGIIVCASDRVENGLRKNGERSRELALSMFLENYDGTEVFLDNPRDEEI
ncbi:MAG: hypothetical protein ABFD92_03890 [Planctomycetaceae bacterium]|nr:hypothetical protein [Planctomycetaceae bacterium]